MLCFYISIPIEGRDNIEGILRLNDEEEKAFFEKGKGYDSNLPNDAFDLELLYWGVWDMLEQIGIKNPMDRTHFERADIYKRACDGEYDFGDPGDELIAPIYSDLLFRIKIGSGDWEEYAYEQREAAEMAADYWNKWMPGISKDKLITWPTIKHLKSKEGNFVY